MAASAAEATVQRGYLETVLALPWNKKSEDSEDLENAWKVLEEGHYGLKDVKERIMEFLAVRKLTHKGKSPILAWWDLPEPEKLPLPVLWRRP